MALNPLFPSPLLSGWIQWGGAAKTVLDNAIRILQAMVDITANNGFLRSALRCMALLQMVMQGRWHHDNSLLQLPRRGQRQPSGELA